jgi:hypothetical protein
MPMYSFSIVDGALKFVIPVDSFSELSFDFLLLFFNCLESLEDVLGFLRNHLMTDC